MLLKYFLKLIHILYLIYFKIYTLYKLQIIPIVYKAQKNSLFTVYIGCLVYCF